jgi:hypothetical protein
MFMHFTGRQGGQSRVFGINHPTGGGVFPAFDRLALDRSTDAPDRPLFGGTYEYGILQHQGRR